MSRRINNWIAGYMDLTENTEPPILFRKWVAVSTIASVLKRKCYLEWDKQTFPNMYIVLVAPSGKARKGTAMGPGYSMLRQLGIKLAAEAVTKEALIRSISESGDLKVDKETGHRISYSCAITILSQELTVFLGYQNKELMAFLCDWYDCRDYWEYKTKNAGVDQIYGLWVNLIGATTPDLLQVTLPRDAIGGGLTSRVIFVYETKKNKLVPFPFPTQKEKELREDLIIDLERIGTLSGPFTITDAWMDRYNEWYYQQAANPPFTHEHFMGYVERRPTHLLKLCMIMNVARTDDMTIDRIDIDNALELLTDTERKMPATFAGIGSSRDAVILNKVMATVASNRRITIAKLLELHHQDLDRDSVSRVLYAMTTMKFAKLVNAGSDSFIEVIEAGTTQQNNGRS